MSRIVIVGYRPRAGQSTALKKLLASHVPRLKRLGLVTDREPIVMEAADGTVVEVFEWASTDAIERAHSHPDVQSMWNEFAQVCDYVPIGETAEAGQLFSEYAAIDMPSSN